MAASRATRPSDPAERVPTVLRDEVDQIFSLTDELCTELLDDEYAALCRKLTAKLSRKRPSPLLRRNLNIWAAAVVHTVGAINFLFDPSQSPHLSGDQISAYAGVPKSTIAAKSRVIREALQLRPNDPDFCRRSLLANHPWAWFIEFQGLVLDARWLPRQAQEIAFRKGLIPSLDLLEQA